LIACDPHRAAIKLLANLTQREALVLTYNDLLLRWKLCLFSANAATAGPSTAVTNARADD
jgi:hypothetical protein